MLSSPGLTGRSSIPETVVIESISRGVLDRPVEPGDDTEKDVRPCDRGADDGYSITAAWSDGPVWLRSTALVELISTASGSEARMKNITSS